MGEAAAASGAVDEAGQGAVIKEAVEEAQKVRRV